jgi:hypothetical protein
MAKALQPAVKAGEIVFELDRFEVGEGDRLELRGRWFGVRGRRFVRPTLTLVSEAGPARRALADLEHKPWAADDGDSWEAAFPWRGDGEVYEAELAVAPDITITLPAPGSNHDPAHRIAAHRRGGSRTPDPPDRDQAPAPSAATKPAARRTRAKGRRPGELEALREELATVRAELEQVRAELEQVRAELETAQLASAEAANAASAAELERAVAEERRDAAVSEVKAAIAARDAALRERDAVKAERARERGARERIAAERDRAQDGVQWLTAELEEARAALQEALRDHREATMTRDRAIGERDSLFQTGERLAQERDEAIAARGAALVMRNATRAMPGHERHAGWVQRALAIVLLIGVMFALLAVLHVL